MGEDGTNHLRPMCLYIYQFAVDNFFHTVADIVHTLSRLSARSALLPAAEVSTGDPRPTAFDFLL